MSIDAMHASVTSLTYVQLTDAVDDSTAEQDTRFTAFLTAADIAIANPTAEATAEMRSCWASYKAQQAMTGAILAELGKRIKDRNYA